MQNPFLNYISFFIKFSYFCASEILQNVTSQFNADNVRPAAMECLPWNLRIITKPGLKGSGLSQ